MTIQTVLVSIETTAFAALKAAGHVIEDFVINEPQKLVAEAKQLPFATTAMNLISSLETLAGSGVSKMDVVVAALEKLVALEQANGGLKGLAVSAANFARELGQSFYNDFKAAAKPLVVAAEQKLGA